MILPSLASKKLLTRRMASIVASIRRSFIDCALGVQHQPDARGRRRACRPPDGEARYRPAGRRRRVAERFLRPAPALDPVDKHPVRYRQRCQRWRSARHRLRCAPFEAFELRGASLLGRGRACLPPLARLGQPLLVVVQLVAVPLRRRPGTSCG